MDKYTIYCTEEQTKKALELGASIKLKKHTYFDYNGTPHSYEDGEICPTVEQMRGWLEGQGIYIIAPIPLIKDFNKSDFSKADAFEYRVVINGSEVYSGEYLSSKAATLAAIDDALNYLDQTK